MGFKLGPGGTCPRCGEDRITSKIEDRYGPRSYCGVCSYEWRTAPDFCRACGHATPTQHKPEDWIDS